MIYWKNPGKSKYFATISESASAAIALLLFTLFCVRQGLSVQSEGDTAALVAGAREYLTALLSGYRGPSFALYHFPLFQFVPTWLLIGLGCNDGQILSSLGMFNTLLIWFTATAGFWYFYRQKKTTSAWIYFLTLFSSFFLWYANSTFGEPVGAFFAFYLVLNATQASRWIVLSAFLFCLTKEIAWPFAILLGWISLNSQARLGVASKRRCLLLLVAGSMAGFLVNCGFNLWRFGSPWNSFLLKPELHVDTLRTSFSFFLAQWISPNGGLIFFVPMWVVLFATHVKSGFKSQSASWVFFILLALTIGFSRWFAPLGWVAWGPRFLVPWVPALTFLLLLDLPPLGKYFWKSTIGLVTIFGLVQFLATLDRYPLGWFFSPSSACPKDLDVFKNKDLYFECIQSALWPHGSDARFILLNTLRLNLPGRLFWVILYFSLVGLAIRQFRRTRMKNWP